MINMKGKYMKSCLDFLIQDAVNNPPFYTTAKVTGIENDTVSFSYKDKQGLCKVGEIQTESSDKYNIGEILDIQICGAMFPEIFVVRREANR